MLGVVLREGSDNKKQQEIFKDFNNWTEEQDGSIGGTLICWFARFQDRNYNGCRPHGWKVSIADGQAEKIGHLSNGLGAKVLKVDACKAIRAGSRGNFG
jgi:hypothetical protein